MNTVASIAHSSYVQDDDEQTECLDERSINSDNSADEKEGKLKYTNSSQSSESSSESQSSGEDRASSPAGKKILLEPDRNLSEEIKPASLSHNKEQKSGSTTPSVSSEQIENVAEENAEAQSNTALDSNNQEKSISTESITSESEFRLFQSILSDSSSEKILTDIEVTSPKERLSSSTEEELLKKFREQQAARRFRPRSAKLRHSTEPEPETVLKVETRSSESSDEERFERPKPGKLRKHKKTSKSSKSSSTLSESKGSDNNKHSSSSTSADDLPTTKDKAENRKESIEITEHDQRVETVVSTKTEVKRADRKESVSENTSSSLTTEPTTLSDSIAEAKRPRTALGRRKKYHKKLVPVIPHPVTETEEKPQLYDFLKKKSVPVPENLTNENDQVKGRGFPWPYIEDCTGSRATRRLIDYHKSQITSILAQEYLQRHLEVELTRLGAQFEQYDIKTKPFHAKDITKFRERNINWVYLDGRLYNITKEMGAVNEAQRGRRKNKISPKKERDKTTKKSISRDRSSKSSEKSARSVSFDKSAKGGSSSHGGIRKFLRGLSPRGRSSERRGSGRSSRSSIKNSRSRSHSSSKSSRKENRNGKPSSRRYSQSSSGRDRSRSRESSRSGDSRKESKYEKDKTLKRPQTAKHSKSGRRSRETTIRSDHKSDRSKVQQNLLGLGSSRKDRHDSTKSSKNKLKPVLFTAERDLLKSHYEREEPRERTGRRQADDMFLPKGRHTWGNSSRRKQWDSDDFYRDINIPGHAFPYYYLSYLLEMDRLNHPNQYHTDSRGGKIILRPAPRRTKSGPKHPKSKIQEEKRHCSPSPKQRRSQKKTKCVINTEEKEKQERSRSVSSESKNSHSSHPTSQPRIRPGSGPIKCSWKSKSESPVPKYRVSDHQLKNTENPVILEWLRHKDLQMRARKQNEIRKQKKKRAKLIDEQNEIEDKHERALQRYETWKRDKDKEILMRRRKEALEASSASFQKKESSLSAKRKERPRTAPSANIKNDSTFSELRSSSASPEVAKKTTKPRPKSANVQGVSFSNSVETINERPRSASPNRKQGDDGKSVKKQKSVFAKTEQLFKNFLGIKGDNKDAESKSSSEQKTESSKQMNGIAFSDDRESYDKWVRAKPLPIKKDPKIDQKKSPRKTSPNQRHIPKQNLPAHNYRDNDMITELAKRRIETILASRKQVDSGLSNRRQRRVKSGRSGMKGEVTNSSSKIWKLREDDIISENRTQTSNSQRNVGSSSSSSSDDRPKFSFSRKTKSKSTAHERNPIIRRALNHS